MHDHEHVHVVVDPLETRGGKVPDLEQLLDPLEDQPRLRGPAHHHRLLALPVERQGGEQSDDRPRGLSEGVDHLGEVVLQELLALGREARDDLLVVEGVGADQSEIERGLAVEERDPVQAVGDGPVLLLGERLGVDRGEDDLPLPRMLVLLEEVAHPRDVAGDGRKLGRKRARDVEPEGDRLLERPDDVAGALGQGEEPLLGQIEPEAGEGLVAEHVDGDEHRHREHDASDRVGPAAQVSLPRASLLVTAAVSRKRYRALLASSTRTFTNSHSAMRDAKYTTSRKSMTPLTMSSKWRRKLKELTVSTR